MENLEGVTSSLVLSTVSSPVDAVLSECWWACLAREPPVGLCLLFTHSPVESPFFSKLIHKDAKTFLKFKHVHRELLVHRDQSFI